MKKMSETIVFFGSGPVAAESLRLLSQSFKIEAVVTKPTTLEEMKAATPSVEIHAVTDRKELDNLIGSNPFQSKVGVLIDFGIIVSQSVIDYFSLGIVNSHFSLLPEWRGADPIAFAILSGQSKTGVSLMLIDAGMDTGKILVQKSLPIESTDTISSLTEKLIVLSNRLLAENLPRYFSGELTPRSQPHPVRATYSRKLTKEDGIIDWSKPAAQIEREIRAFREWPKSRANIAGKDIVITEAFAAPTVGENGKPGDVTIVEETKSLAVETSNGSIYITKLKPAGKNEMTSEAFLAGHRHLL
jgi:methionyl-tRNA formyltransferase